MLSTEEQRQVEQVLLDFARRGQSRAAETATILSRMPANPEAIDVLVSLARRRGLPWVEFLVRTMQTLQSGQGEGDRPAPPDAATSGLEELLARDEPYPRKVDALLAAAKSPTPALADLIRRRLPWEGDAFVLATLASCLGQCGAAQDKDLLCGLLVHSDTRVVANALEALRRLSLPVSVAELEPICESSDNRVRMNALSLLARTDTARALELVAEQLTTPDPSRRSGLGFLLGDLAGHAQATALLFEMLALESQSLVLKQLERSLRRHVTTENAATFVERLTPLQQAAAGAKRSVLDVLVLSIQGGTKFADLEEADTELSFSEVWGVKPEPRSDKKVPAVPEPEPPPPPSRAGLVWLVGAVGGLALIGGVMSMQPAPKAEEPVPASVAIRRANPKKAPVQLVAAPPRAAAAVSAGGGGGFTTSTDPDSELPVVGKKGVAIPRHFGAIGIPIDVNGVVVGGGKGSPIIKAKGRHYMIVSGKFPEDLRTGDPLHLLGRTVGRSIEGLFYVEARN